MISVSFKNKSFLLVLFLKLIILIGLSVYPNESKSQVNLAFPGADGFGKKTKGGRGGQVIIVTNLNDSGGGSFRSAVNMEGPRIVLFDISGTLDLETPIIITEPFLTIAGQTAPNGGIAFRGNKVVVAANDVIIRFVRFRPGDISFGPNNNWDELDALEIGDITKPVYNVIIDHCSFSWAVDENIGILPNVYNLTVQNSVISEGLYFSKHTKQPHSMGMLVGFGSERVSIINNIFIHNNKRHPRLSNGGLADVRNNIIYNPAYMGINLWNRQGLPQEINIVGNLFIPGPNTNIKKEISFWDPPIYIGKAYIKDNVGFDGDKSRDNWDMVQDAKSFRHPLTSDQIKKIRADKEFPSEVSYTKSFIEMTEFADKYIGASLPFRDPVDTRVINDWKNRTGKIINSQNDVGGWPNLNTDLQRGYSFEFIDEKDKNNGILKEWLAHYNILPGQENEDFNANGYTNTEEYLNGTNPRGTESPSWMDIFEYWGGATIRSNATDSIAVNQNFPNPFYDKTTIRFSLKNKGRVIIIVFDLNGKIVATLVNSELYKGEYEVIWKPDSYIKSGIYIAHINNSNMLDNILMHYIKE